MVDLELNELKRFNELQGDWKKISEFLQFLEDNNVIMAERYGPERLMKASAPLKTMLADYYEVDLVQVAKEKDMLVDYYLNEMVASG